MTATEDALFYAYRHAGGYSCECVCGGWITCQTAGTIAAAVRLHNASVLHQRWRDRLSAEETTTVASRDLSGFSGDTSSPLLRVGYQTRRTH